MNSFHKLPFLLSASMAVLVGVISISLGADNQAVYLRMVITMVVFYVVGLYTGKTLDKLKTEVNEKNAEIERKKILLEEKEKEASQMAEKNPDPFKGQNINLSAEDQDDEFEPLTVSRVISSKMNQ